MSGEAGRVIRFICGCRLMDGDQVSTDAEGFIICSTHHTRRYGWRSVPYTATTMTAKGMGGWTELEYERYVLYGTVPHRAELMTKGEFFGAMAQGAANREKARA